MKRKGYYLCYVIIGFLIILTGLMTYPALHLREAPVKHPINNPKEQVEPSYRANYHFTTPDKWKNDPQRPIYLNGKYHYYYLYNRDYPNGNGTEWRHATSEDLVHWKDEGIAIPKYTNENGDPWSGSVVLDKENTAGFGKNTLIAIVTQPSKDGRKQEQFLWYSKDFGKTFTSFRDEPIMENPGSKDFRDPKIIWDDRHQKWIMVMAEGNKIGFYESHNLKEWHYLSGFMTKDIGLVECPDLFLMRANNGTLKWVLGVSANGKSQGKPNTYAYWTGMFDGKAFFPDNNKPKWVDYGFDWYGGVTFEDGTAKDPYNQRYALAWMNNWDYAHNTPTLKEGFNGMDSVVRQIELMHAGENEYYLRSQPMKELNNLITSIFSYDQIEVDGEETLDVTGEVYQLETDITWKDLKNVGIRLRESNDRQRHVDVGIFAEEQNSYVNRAFTSHPDKRNQLVKSTAPFDSSKRQAHLTILVDKTSIEVFVNDGKVAHSNLIFPKKEDKGITLYTEGGRAMFKNIKIKQLGSIH
ncbi:levanase [Bacillus sp. SA1-12]|uniref:glycoside hydrolase family 32 protein n=1 Tax=Bacillus sp. SA1-12 TaxID=1455638 RepID=UPI000626FB14|nr:glycoside hydrolase family 32 protein [Bacillus sp. SA1-12]KKI89178.1 levanase [Bacillus sp. SA1-12]